MWLDVLETAKHEHLQNQLLRSWWSLENVVASENSSYSEILTQPWKLHVLDMAPSQKVKKGKSVLQDCAIGTKLSNNMPKSTSKAKVYLSFMQLNIYYRQKSLAHLSSFHLFKSSFFQSPWHLMGSPRQLYIYNTDKQPQPLFHMHAQALLLMPCRQAERMNTARWLNS